MADDLNARGITTTRGGQWAPRNLSRTLGNPLYGGMLAYRGETITKLANVEPILDSDTYEAVQAKLGARKRGPRVTGRYPLSGIAALRQPGVRQARHDGRAPAHRRPAGLHLPAGNRRLRAVGARRPGRGDRAGPGAGATGRRGDGWRRCGPPTPPWTQQRAKLRGLLDDLDADMAETEAKRADTPRSMTRRREQHERNLATIAARYEATERELDELGPAAAPAPPLAPITASSGTPTPRQPTRRRSSADSACASRSCRAPARRVPRGCRSRTGGSRSPRVSPRGLTLVPPATVKIPPA